MPWARPLLWVFLQKLLSDIFYQAFLAKKGDKVCQGFHAPVGVALLGQLGELPNIRNGVSPLPVGHRLETDVYFVRQLHLGHVVFLLKFRDFRTYRIHCKHKILLSAWECFCRPCSIMIEDFQVFAQQVLVEKGENRIPVLLEYRLGRTVYFDTSTIRIPVCPAGNSSMICPPRK